MGGAVSAGRDNNDLVDNLVASNYIRTLKVQKVFRAVDRADYLLPEKCEDAYKDLAWKEGLLHLSAPCIYSEVMEALDLEEGQSFLNLGSGTGYLSTMAGLMLGARGINHGIELYDSVIQYASRRLANFLKNSPAVDEFDFCVPVFIQGNGLCLSSVQYDRVYCGAGCPKQMFDDYLKNIIKVGGILVFPMEDMLLQVVRVSQNEWKTRPLLSVTFSPLVLPTKEETLKSLNPMERAPASLQVLTRSLIRNELRKSIFREKPELEEQPIRPMTSKNNSATRRICIPIDRAGDFHVYEEAGDNEDGRPEMNALLDLVLNFGRHRMAGALRFDSFNTESEMDEAHSNDEEMNFFANGTESHNGSVSSVRESSTEDSDDDSDGGNRVERAERDLADIKNQLAEIKTEELGPSDSEAEDKRDTFESAMRRIKKLERDIEKYKNMTLRKIDEQKASTSSDSNAKDCRSKSDKDEAEPDEKKCKKEESKSPKTVVTLAEVNCNNDESNKMECTSTAASTSSDNSQSPIVAVRLVPIERHNNNNSDDENAPHLTARLVKRSRHSTPPSTSSSDDESSDVEQEEPIRPTRQKVKKIAKPDVCDVRRNQISTMLKERTKNLSLPVPLKVYINMGRIFE